MELDEVHERSVEAIRDGIAFLFGGFPIADSGKVLLDVSDQFRALAICHLLVHDDLDAFQINLTRSGYARLYFLRRCQIENNVEDRRQAVSRSLATMDCLAAGSWTVAQEIARQSPNTWRSTWEYEEDYCYHRFVDLALRPEDDVSDAQQQLLKRWENVIDGAPDTRLPVCRALLDHDGEAFHAALQDLMGEVQQDIDERRTTITPPRFIFWPNSFVSIEGLAWIRLGKHKGLSFEAAFTLCPERAQLPATGNIPPDMFRDIEKELARGS